MNISVAGLNDNSAPLQAARARYNIARSATAARHGRARGLSKIAKTQKVSQSNHIVWNPGGSTCTRRNNGDAYGI